MKIREIRPLNGTERQAIADALDLYIHTFGDKKSWSQKVIRDEMLFELMWCAYEK
jgi:hypothetical protein